MAAITAPYVETQQVVTGFIYQLHIAEEENGTGITRLDIGPYFFPGAPPRVKYPEAVTNEMCPPGWQGIRWVSDAGGASWLRWEGGRLRAEDGEQIFQLTSNYPPSNTGAQLYVWRQGAKSADRFTLSAPDYSQPPPKNNPRHDVKGQKSFAQATGCAPLLALGALILAAARHWL
ncbi:MAG: hypothetical protein JO250_00085 [Armatimonadetes bacterium]|nr:hypothetical protein [Armatimonadota bacterium]